MRVAALRIYPVKGLRGIDVPSARLRQQGLEHDRRWAIAAPDGTAITQRDLPTMARIDARIEGTTLRLECAGHGGTNAAPTDIGFTLDVWREKIPTRAANPEASLWLSDVLGTPCTLVHQSDPVTPS